LDIRPQTRSPPAPAAVAAVVGDESAAPLTPAVRPIVSASWAQQPLTVDAAGAREFESTGCRGGLPLRWTAI